MNFFKHKEKRRIIGLTLSGGGMRGVAHIGILQALEEYGLRPAVISGTSSGAIIGAFYAAGYSPDKMKEIVLKTTFFSRSSFRLGTTGLFNTNFLIRLFNANFSENNFSILKIPLHVAATEITMGYTAYFSSGKLFEALLASSAIPFVFPPVRVNEKVFMDGGIMNNFPIEPIRNKCNFLIGAHVNSLIHDDMQKISAKKLFDRVVHIAIGNSVYTKSRTCNLFFDPPEMTKYSLFDKKDVHGMLDAAYRYAVNLLEGKGYTKIK